MDRIDRPATENASLVSGRIMSIDALRGFDMFWIVGADHLIHGLAKIDKSPLAAFFATQLTHCRWEGFHFYDLIFPLFLFLIGLSTVFSLDKIIKNDGIRKAHIRIFRRFVLMFLLGAFYDDGISNLAKESPFSGVLQRLAWCYLFTALMYCHLGKRALIAVCVSILIGYWALLTFVPAPGLEKTSMESGQTIVNWFDQHYLPFKEQGQDWDPEGLLSTIPAVASCMLGLFAGLVLRDTSDKPKQMVLRFIVAGVLMTSIGYLWGLEFPVIKSIWTSSYVLVAGGYSLILLSVFYMVVDVWKIRWWAIPFVWIGANPLTIYLSHDLINFHEISNRLLGGPIAAEFGKYGYILVSAGAIFFIFLFARFLYKRQIFLRV